MDISNRLILGQYIIKNCLDFSFSFKCAFQNIPIMLILVKIWDKADDNFEFYSAFFYSSGGG